MADYEAASRAIIERTARLKALRLGERSYRSTKLDGASFFGKEETALTAAMKCESESELATSWSVGRSA